MQVGEFVGVLCEVPLLQPGPVTPLAVAVAGTVAPLAVALPTNRGSNHHAVVALDGVSGRKACQ